MKHSTVYKPQKLEHNVLICQNKNCLCTFVEVNLIKLVF